MVENIAVGLIIGGALLYIVLYYRKLRKQKRCTGCSFSGECSHETSRDKKTCTSEETKLKNNGQE